MSCFKNKMKSFCLCFVYEYIGRYKQKNVLKRDVDFLKSVIDICSKTIRGQMITSRQVKKK